MNIRGIQALICAVLNSAIRDIRNGVKNGTSPESESALYFVRSKWCESLCSDIGVSYQAYRKYCLALRSDR